MNGAVWAMEWMQAGRRQRVLALSAGVPLLLVLVVALGGAPAPHAALVYSVLFTFFGTFGAAIPWARDAERGLLHRLVLAGLPMPTIALQRLAASALLDLLELVPSLFVIAVLYHVAAPDAIRLFALVGLGLLAANALGMLVAALAGSLAETALLAAVSALLLLHAGGVFRTPPPGGALELLQRAIPFHYMHEAIRAAVGAL
ncbi:MAG: ABC transporter permease [Gemmatimonadales bacterium]